MFNRKMKVRIDDTHFIFQTNFSGDPARDRFGSNRRYFNVIIPTKQQADDIAAMGVNVRQTQPNPNKTYDGEFQPAYFVRVTVNMESKWPPHVIWVAPNGQRTEMTPETIGNLDFIRVKNVCCQANLVEKRNQPGAYTLYADIVYVEQADDYDPYKSRYDELCKQMSDDSDLPF